MMRPRSTRHTTSRCGASATRVAMIPTVARARPDGRADEHARALVVALDVVSHAAGSAYVELGDTKVSCAVYGPRQHRGGDTPARVDRGALDVDVVRAPFADGAKGRANAREGARGAAETSLAATVREALRASVMVERFPKTQVDVYATVLDARGGEAVACVLAATAALARAGVECRDLVTACEAARIGDRIVLDPDEREVAASDGKVFLAQMSSLDGYAKTEIFGRWSPDDATRALDVCAAGCQRFDATIREVLRDAL